MPFVISRGNLQSVSRPPFVQALPPQAVTLADGITSDYAEIWRSQPQVRTVVSFLARNIAQLSLHVFRRVSDLDRQRINDHPVAQLINRPNPWTTRYRWIEALVSDLGVFDNAVLAKMRHQDQPRALVRLDPRGVQPLGDNPWTPDVYRLHGQHGHRDLPADQIVHMRGYNPLTDRWGSSPIETLRSTLAEEFEAARYRQQLWRNSARLSGYIERPLDAPQWNTKEKSRFRSQWQAQYTGTGPSAGGTPILEDGMKFHESSVTPESAQYIESRKLSREEVAAAYHIPLPMVGILDHATFSNVREQHKHLYQDTLGPWLTAITEELHLQLLPDFPDVSDVYLEFNLAEKLRGSFEEQAQQLSTSVGAPWMTRNEARARMNLPQLDDGDGLVTPLNVILSGQTSQAAGAVGGAATGTAAALPPATRSNGPRLVMSKARPDEQEADLADLLAQHFERQARVVTSELGAAKWRHAGGLKVAADDLLDARRWITELADDLYPATLAISSAAGAAALAHLGLDDTYDTERTQAWHRKAARSIAESITVVTLAHLGGALNSDDPPGAVDELFAAYATTRVVQLARSTVTEMAGFGTTEAVRQTGRSATKTWITTSGNPRSTHARLNGETVGIDDEFSNRARWPGDSVLDEDERANCRCDLVLNLP
jgi:HK97 family phage portal protein